MRRPIIAGPIRRRLGVVLVVAGGAASMLFAGSYADAAIAYSWIGLVLALSAKRKGQA